MVDLRIMVLGRISGGNSGSEGCYKHGEVMRRSLFVWILCANSLCAQFLLLCNVPRYHGEV